MIRNYTIVLLLLINIVLGVDCCAQTKQQKPIETDQSELVLNEHPLLKHRSEDNLSLEDWTFTIKIRDPKDGQLYGGKAFILEHRLVTAKHMFIRRVSAVEKDVRTFGTSSLKGLSLCREEHIGGTTIYYKVIDSNKKYHNYGLILKSNKNNYYTTFQQGIYVGDSGTPVLCIRHNNVIGLVSVTIIGTFEGFIEKITDEDLK